MKKSPEQMMEELYKFYNEQCPHEKINHGGYSEEKTEGFIILESGTEIVHFSNYQGGYAIKFLFVRGLMKFSLIHTWMQLNTLT